MRSALLNKLFESAPARCDEKRLARHAVVIGDLALVFDLVEPVFRESVAAVFSVVPVVAADPIGSFHVAAVAQVLLNRVFRGAVCLLAHDRFLALNRVLLLHSL